MPFGKDTGTVKNMIGIIVLIAVVVGLWALVESKKQSERDVERAWQKVQDDADRINASNKKAALEKTIEFVRLKFGDSEANRYKLCETYPPKLKKHQLECKALERKVDRALADTPEW